MNKQHKPPKRFIQFTQDFPKVAEAYSNFGHSVHHAGPLDERTRALVKVALSGGAGIEGAFHAHVRKARMLDLSWDEITHVALMAMPTIGFPRSVALLSWIDDVKKKEEA
jgi:alkylhydroperoxidase/carboxymuconolactone decarboxylase family protein YurZ